MLFDNLQREKVSKREGYHCFFFFPCACFCLAYRSSAEPQDVSWAACKKYMGNVDAFLKMLLSFDKDNIPEACVDKVEKDYIKQSYFTPEAIKMKSAAAGGLCGWVVNICKYFRIYQVPPTPYISSPTPLPASRSSLFLGAAVKI
jgi:hypothetical protein